MRSEGEQGKEPRGLNGESGNKTVCGGKEEKAIKADIGDSKV